jgi:hypothetical protein
MKIYLWKDAYTIIEVATGTVPCDLCGYTKEDITTHERMHTSQNAV